MHDAGAGKFTQPTLRACCLPSPAQAALGAANKVAANALVPLAWVSWACQAHPHALPLQQTGTAHCQQQLAQGQGTAEAPGW